MPEIHPVEIQIRAPKNGDQGQTSIGRYTLDGDTVTLVDLEGKPAVDDTGRRYAQTLKAGEHHKTIAGRLARQLRTALRGDDGPINGFSGPIAYRKTRRA